jgi:hypothetical protein
MYGMLTWQGRGGRRTVPENCALDLLPLEQLQLHGGELDALRTSETDSELLPLAPSSWPPLPPLSPAC